MRIRVINVSTRVTDSDVKDMCKAVDQQLYHHAAPAYNRRPDRVIFAATRADQSALDGAVIVADDVNQAQGLGWHSLNPELAYGFVYAQTVLQNGGNSLNTPVSVASVLSHRCLELSLCPQPNMMVDAGDGWLWQYNVCDPVEGDTYPVHPSGVTVSNFCLPAFFDPQGAGRFDFMGKLTAPFTIGDHGFASRMRAGHRADMLGPNWIPWYDATKA